MRELILAPKTRRPLHLSSLRYAVLALQADGNQFAAEAVCRAIVELAPDTAEAEWASRRLARMVDSAP